MAVDVNSVILITTIPFFRISGACIFLLPGGCRGAHQLRQSRLLEGRQSLQERCRRTEQGQVRHWDN